MEVRVANMWLLATNDIVDTVTQLQNRGIEFLKVPSTYYDDLLQRVGPY